MIHTTEEAYFYKENGKWDKNNRTRKPQNITSFLLKLNLEFIKYDTSWMKVRNQNFPSKMHRGWNYSLQCHVETRGNEQFRILNLSRGNYEQWSTLVCQAASKRESTKCNACKLYKLKYTGTVQKVQQPCQNTSASVNGSGEMSSYTSRSEVYISHTLLTWGKVRCKITPQDVKKQQPIETAMDWRRMNERWSSTKGFHKKSNASLWNLQKGRNEIKQCTRKTAVAIYTTVAYLKEVGFLHDGRVSNMYFSISPMGRVRKYIAYFINYYYSFVKLYIF